MPQRIGMLEKGGAMTGTERAGTGRRRAGAFWCAMVCVATFAGTVGVADAAPTGGGNGRIAYVWFDGKGAAQIFAMDPDGTNVQQLTHVGKQSGASGPAWSPDGSSIVYSQFPDGTIHVMRADGSNNHVLFKDPLFGDSQPSYSPDGKTIVFSRCRPPEGPCTLYTVRSDGAKLHQLLPFSVDGADLDGHYSPDGTRILDAHFYQEGKIAAVAVMNADGTGLHTITPGGLTAAGAEWSPDGTRLAFFSHCCDPKISEIWTVAADGSGRTRLTKPAPSHDFVPTYSPDGSLIAFERDAPDFSSADIWVMNADGSGATMIHAGGFNPEWSPAGATS